MGLLANAGKRMAVFSNARVEKAMVNSIGTLLSKGFNHPVQHASLWPNFWHKKQLGFSFAVSQWKDTGNQIFHHGT